MLPEIDGLSKDTVVTSWMAKYDALMKGKFYIFRLQIQGFYIRYILFNLNMRYDEIPYDYIFILPEWRTYLS